MFLFSPFMNEVPYLNDLFAFLDFFLMKSNFANGF